MALKVGDLLAVLRADTGDFERKMRGATQGLVSPRGLLGAFGAVTAATAAFAAAATGAGVALARLTNRGGAVLNVQRAFNRATGQSEMAIRQLRDATEGLISDFDLMQGFNRALALGAARNAQEFGELSRTAITLGRALGVDATFAMESLSLGIGRQSRLILDNLGLIVSVEQANKDYAAALGKTAAELTSAEQKEAFRTAAMEAARSKIEQLGGIQETNADNITRLRIAYQNFRDELAQLVATSPVVAQFFDGLTIAAQGLAAVIRETLDPGRLGADLRSGLVRIANQNAEANERYARSLSVTREGLVTHRDLLLQRLGLEEDQLAAIRQQREGWRGILNTVLSLIPLENDRIRLADDLHSTLQQIANTDQLIKAASKASAEATRQAATATSDLASATGDAGAGAGRMADTFQVAWNWAFLLAEQGRHFRAVFGDGAIAEDIKAIGDELDMLAERAKEAMDEAKSGMKESLEKGTIAATKNFGDIGEQAGKRLIDGVISGSLDMENLLKSILSSLIQRALFGGILAFSPSRLGIEAGERLQQGMMRGVQNMNRMLTATIQTGVAGALDRAAPAAAVTQPAGALTVNMPAIPEPVTPEAQAVNRYWLQVWTATSRAAKMRGFRG